MSQKLPNPSMASKSSTDSSKFNSPILYKSIAFSILLFLLPILPSKPPESITQSLQTRSWELIQLVLVGIAVSYGLFSKRNDEEEETENFSKSDSKKSDFSSFFHDSSFFGVESENPSLFDKNKAQIWSSTYCKGESITVVEQGSSVFEEQRGEKSLNLPIRSLKSCISDSSQFEITSCSNRSSPNRSISNSNSTRSSRNSSKSWNEEFSNLDSIDSEGKFEENDFVISPVRWRSKSGRIEMKENRGIPPPPPIPIEKSEFSRIKSPPFSPKSTQSSKPNSIYSYPNKKKSFSPQKFSPSSSFSSSDSLSGKTGETEEFLERALFSAATKQSSFEFLSDEREEIEEKFDSETDDDWESEDEGEIEGELGNLEDGNSCKIDGNEGPDVDKKADEFIAKFREQIGMQRISKKRF